MRSADNYSMLIDKVNAFTRKYYLNGLLRGLIFLAAGIFTGYITITLLEYFGNFDTVLRTILFYAFILINLLLLVWLVVPSLMAYLQLGRTLTHDEAAQMIGQHFGDVKDKLLNTLQLKKQAAQDPERRALIEASIDQKITMLSPVSFPLAIDLKQNKRYLKWVALPLGMIIIVAFAAPAILTESTKRLIHHDRYFAPLAPFKFVVMNPSLQVMQGADLKLDIKLDGNDLPANAYIQIGKNTFKLEKDNISRFHYLFTGLQQTTLFRITANGYYSPMYQVQVSLKPSLLSADVELVYPSYLHKASEKLSNAGDLTVPVGTVVKWQLHAQNAQNVLFKINDRSEQLSGNDQGVFTYTAKVVKSTTYGITPVADKHRSGDMANYRINIINDEMPAIEVNEKQDSISTKAIYFSGNVRDDHGFTSLTFHYSTSAAGERPKTFARQIKSDLQGTQATFFHYWDIKDLPLTPGSQVTYYFEVADNDGVSGPKKVRSPERTLQVPTKSEMSQQLNANTQAIKQKMRSAIKLAGEVERDAQKLDQLLLNKSSLSFEEKKQIEDLLRKRTELDQLVKDLQAENKKDQYQRQEDQQQSTDLQQKQKQIQDLLNNVMDERSQEILKKLQQLLDQEQKEGTRDQLSKMQNDNRSLKKELDRMLELYKQLDLEQKIDRTVDDINDLANDEQKLSEETKRPGANQQELQKKQEQLKQRFNDIKKTINDIDKANQQLERKNNFDKQDKEQQGIEEKMNESDQQLQKNDKQKAASSQQQASQQMKQMAQKMQQNEQDSEQEDNAADAQQLRELLKTLVSSSFEQEKVMQNFRGMNPNDPAYVLNAQKQKDIKDNLRTAEDTLYALSRRIPQIQATVNQEVNNINDHIDKALESLGDRRTPEANRNQQYAMTAMNNLALMLSEALDQMQNAKSGSSGKSKQKSSMQQLSQMQQRLNQNMQKMREQMKQQGNQGQSAKGQGQQGQSLSEQMARMARQQQDIRQRLQQLSRDQRKDGSGKPGDLEKISKQMEQTEIDLVNKKITEESLNRQQNIQSRLLEAEKAEQEREQDKQRESKAGRNTPPGYIKALQSYEQQKVKQTEQIRTVPSVLNLYYKQKIKRYFEQLDAK
ncbi:hypothetical protein LLH06_00325 [Mucilaginibacter daejeonensis]|uniref:DUF4175 family protein n=1 Tax=Mucilaginibacter daejeonensis TaxID=398049 RepID=UPI001D174345|nr:DUF4175 family protein [Mucilaginibacter daejeonensis]UEG53423.1 hypothetical protein LLH06_00325 [Mucilaginibacter daejeonensis]